MYHVTTDDESAEQVSALPVEAFVDYIAVVGVPRSLWQALAVALLICSRACSVGGPVIVISNVVFNGDVA